MSCLEGNLEKGGESGETRMNDFKKDLEYSLEENENQLFDDFYFRAFKNLERIEIVSDLSLQKQGVDKKLIFSSGKVLMVDEKKRRVDYGDILLEEWSVVETKKIGWTGDPNKHTDYIVYVIMPTCKVYLLPYVLLQMAWRANWHNWKDIYRVRDATNKGYHTSNLAIPVGILMGAIKEQIEAKLTP